MSTPQSWIVAKLALSTNLAPEKCQKVVDAKETANAIKDFLSKDGPERIFFFYQLTYAPSGKTPPLHGKCIYFVRVNATKAVDPKTVDSDLCFGEILGQPLQALRGLVHEFYMPALQQQQDWGNADAEASEEFLGVLEKFSGTLSEAVMSLTEGVELKLPDPAIWKQSGTEEVNMAWLAQAAVASKDGKGEDSKETKKEKEAIQKAAEDPNVMKHFEEVASSWIAQVQKLVQDVDLPRKDANDIGPASELDYWRNRMGRFNSMTEQLKKRECKYLLVVLFASKSPKAALWKAADAALTDNLNEAKDNVKYLSTLDKYTEVLYSGTPPQVIDMLPGLLNNIKMMITIARYYSSAERMTALFVKITNQMIQNCRKYILKGSRNIWEQSPADLVVKLQSCLQLNQVYQEQYMLQKEKLAQQPKVNQFDFNESRIFAKFDLFCKRVQKLVDLFTTIHQFSSLADHNIEGMDMLIKTFFTLVDDFKRKPYDLLDFSKNAFDRDFLEYNVNISELETAIQGFVNASFENISSTEQALVLIRQFETILLRENLRSDLESKYAVIFHNYGLDLEMVQKIYEKQKNNTPAFRNAPPVAGNIMWARHLLRRIEDPMRNFKTNRNIMGQRDSKKINKTYNRVARALVEFEMLWHDAWAKTVDVAKAGLQATLLIKHPRRVGRLAVNFDPEILQLIRESKCLQRIGDQHVPEGAKMVLLQHDKFRSRADRLRFLVHEVDVVSNRIVPIMRAVLKPHLEWLQQKMQPGLVYLTWQSMNVSSYIESVEVAVKDFEELVAKVHDMTDHRIEGNLHYISLSNCISIPRDQSFTIEQFKEIQARTTKRRAVLMDAKNYEVERAVKDLLFMVSSFPLEGVPQPEESELRLVRDHYQRQMYLAVLASTKNSIVGLKQRLAAPPKKSGGLSFTELVHDMDKAFFSADIKLQVPDIIVEPGVDKLQEAVNECTLQVLRVSKYIYMWGDHRREDPKVDLAEVGAQSFHELLAKDKEIVKAVLLVTGAIEGIKTCVADYLQNFKKFTHLWAEDKQSKYTEFMKGNPDLEAFELELKKYMTVEEEVAFIESSQVMGCLILENGPIKASLKSEAYEWKKQYSQNLHSQAKAELEKLQEIMRDYDKRLQRKLDNPDLEDVRELMDVLKQIREREALIDFELHPLEEKYGMLRRYNVSIPQEEQEAMGDIRMVWKKVLKLGSDRRDRLAAVQGGLKKELVSSVKSFVADVAQFRSEWDAAGPMVPGVAPDEAYERLVVFKRRYEERERKWNNYQQGEDLFGLPITEYPELAKTKKELDLLDKLYSLYNMVINDIRGYSDILWGDVISNIDSMSEVVNNYQTQCKKMPKALREWDAYKELKQTIDDFLEVLPLLQGLSAKSIMPRHWEQVMKICGKDIDPNPEVMKLKDLLEMNLLKHAEDVEEVATASGKELQIYLKLEQIKADWSATEFEFQNFKNKGPVTLKMSALAEIIEKLEESQMALGGMATNRYSAPFIAEVKEWILKLSTVGEIIEQWSFVQNLWIYMEAVFSSGDIAKQLPGEAKKFQGVDKQYIKIVSKANEVKLAVPTCYGNELMKTVLPWLTSELEVIQKSLAGYLETKRNLFPRFYFVSDPVLLDILSQGSDPNAVRQHLQAVFDSMCDVTFDRQEKAKIINMISPEGETVGMSNPMIAQGNVEDWLTKLVGCMQETMHDIVRDAGREAASMEISAIPDFVSRFCAQCALLGVQFQWTADCQDALTRAKADKAIMVTTNKKVAAVLSELVVMTTKDLTKLQRTSVETLITIQVHQKDVFDDLVRKKVKDPSDFDWLQQARFYYKWDQDTSIISVTDVDFEYCYEFLGTKERLCVTPLTDRCYITLSQALGMFLGGAPAGPAGTGKTETVKDLGRTLGKFVVVFNCSDQMGVEAMGKIYKGIAMSGVWGCFDEFNRIDLDVLSVCAQQVECILVAARARQKDLVFTDGCKIDLRPECGFFITMNPGYAGRQELPENLKSLFRGCAMMVPDRQIIMKVKLAACGYQENAPLAKKFHVLYRLCEQQLSKQAHYDFGLRNILSVLRTAGSTKRSTPDASESLLLMRTLRDMNLSKYVAEDVPLFLSLIGDLFPGLDPPKATFPEVQAAIEKNVNECGLQLHKTWVGKVIQLYETYQVRHGIMLSGPAGGGKTRIQEMLAKALSDCVIKHTAWKMNPKAITAPQMFGKLDGMTGDWTDGIFAVLWRKANKAKTSNTWIVLDGPVDAIWIENLNTVLDDNKLLTLANGDRIPMIPNVKAMFENENLNNASPATVSRAGIIWVSSSDLGWRPIVDSWISKRREAEGKILGDIFTKYVDPVFEFLTKECKVPMFIVQNNQVTTMYWMLESFLQKSVDTKEIYSAASIERIAIYCLMWAIGGTLELPDRIKLDKYIRSLAKDCVTEPENSSETLFEYYVDEPKTGFAWTHWRGRIPAYTYPDEEKVNFAALVIPTLDSVRYDSLLHLNRMIGRPCLLMGLQGTTKTATIDQYLARVKGDDFAVKSITFSSATTPGIFQKILEGSVEKRQGRTFGPAGGKKMGVFIDDISMPEINAWGDQITNEIVRQQLEETGMYALDKPGEKRDIIDLWFVAAMNQPGGGKNDIPNRLKRHFSILNVTMPSLVAIDNIFGTMMRGRFTDKFFKDANILQLAYKMTDMTISLWQKVQATRLPTPKNFHYYFNMRDLSRIFQGVMFAPRESIKDEAYLCSLWKHETERVFCDKLTSLDHKNWFKTVCSKLIEQECGAPMAKLQANSSFFVNFLRDPVFDDEGICINEHPLYYEIVPSLPDLRTRVEGFMRQFNEDSKVLKLDLVLFEDALGHLMRISRIICMDRGSALLVGVGGSGKQSLTRLAAYISGHKPFQITISKHYAEKDLYEDLKYLFREAGFKGQPMAFIFTDAEVKDEGFLEFINQALATGEVANLFPKDELDAIVGDIRPAMKRESPQTIDTYDNLYRFFLQRARNNLHIVLCFSPVGNKFSTRARKFPGLISQCNIDWFLPWPDEALRNVSAKFIGEFEMATTSEIKDQLISHMGTVHSLTNSATQKYIDRFRRYVYVTPKSYLSFIAGYKSLYKKKHGEVKLLADKINTGLKKLLEAGEQVGQMKIELQQKEVSLAEAQKVSAALLVEIQASTAKAEKKKAEVMEVKNKLFAQATIISKDKAECENDLSKAAPALEAAEKALESISAKDIQALKALKKPPNMVKVIFDGVLLLRKLPIVKVQWPNPDGKVHADIIDSYAYATKYCLNDSKFVESLLHFPKDQMNDETVELLAPYTEREDFTFLVAQKAAGNVAGLCDWVKAMCSYHTIAKFVAPKTDALRKAEASLLVANKKLASAMEDLAVCQGELDAMQAKFDAAKAEKQRLQDDADLTKRRMDSANALMSGLGGEKVRWTQQSKEFADEIARLVGDCAIASSFISYLGPFNKEFRDIMQKDSFYKDLIHKKIPVTQDLVVTKFLTDESETGEWNIQGLPSDELSIQNGLLVTRSARWPILIDPQGQGLSWMTKKNEANQLKITAFYEKQFRAHLEDCLSWGKPMIIENLEEETDPILDAVLEKAIVQKGKKFLITLSDGKQLDYVETFSLVLTTKMPNPHYTPELSARVTVIDFTVTMKGLEDQLLGRVIAKEKTELQEQRQALLAEVNNYKKKIKELEDDLLRRLSESSGNLLDDASLIDVLADTKKTSLEVGEKLVNANETEKRIIVACEEFRPVATRGSVIYFLVSEMAAVNCMYQTSLVQFLELFEQSIDRSAKSPVPAKRITSIIKELTFTTFLYVCRGLFERHKVLYKLLLALKVQMMANELTPDHFSCFLKGGAALDINNVRKKPKEWIPDMSWLHVINLSNTLPVFKDLPDSMFRSEGIWKQWYDQEMPEATKIPEFEEKLDRFGRLLIVRSLREDRALLAGDDYVADTLGKEFSDSYPLDVEKMWGESNCRCPIICILSPGSDPTESIQKLAKKFKKECLSVSMGRGQEVIAKRFVAAQTLTGVGGWVLLQNTHLGLGYVGELEQFLLKTEEIDDGFRFWITAEPNPGFPIGLLQMSIKFTNEAPVGMRAGLKRSYAWINQDMLDSVPRQEWRQLLYVQCFLHSVTQERRKFGPIGWSVPYEFNQGDLTASVNFIQNHLAEMDTKKSKEVTWSTVRYMVSEIQYGGRITDDWDRVLMSNYTEKYFFQGVLSETYKFYPLPGYTVPQGLELAVFKNHIENMPPVDNPEIFGLHMNADLTYRMQQTQELTLTIMETQPKQAGAGGGKTREEIVNDMAGDMLGKMPKDFNLLEVREYIAKQGATNPLNIFLRQECERFRNISLTTRNTLKDLQLAIAGTIALNSNLINALDALFDALVPASWLKISWASPTLGLWFAGLLARDEQLQKWVFQGRPKTFWLTGWFNAQGFLTAMQQEVSRKHQGWALDDVVIFSEVQKMENDDVKEGPAEGVYINGLFLEGCAWSKKDNKLVDSSPKVLYHALPVLFVTAVLGDSGKEKKNTYNCPVYTTKRRGGLTFIAALGLRSEDTQMKWILRGVGLLCSKD